MSINIYDRKDMRGGKKKEQGMTDKDKHIEDIEKAINHLEFELEKINKDEL